jgi:hypothetical protein
MIVEPGQIPRFHTLACVAKHANANRARDHSGVESVTQVALVKNSIAKFDKIDVTKQGHVGIVSLGN